MSAFVPASTAVKRNRVQNVDDDRLVRRRLFLRPTLNGTHHDRRIDFVMRAAELHAIENALTDRGVLPADERITTRST